jgi:hypothetical protein
LEDSWLTYAEAAERLNTTAEGIRQRAIRKRWQRQVGNDGLARVRLPEQGSNPVRTANKRGGRTPSEQGSNNQIIKALEDHLVTMREQLAQAQARIGELTADLEGREAQHLVEITQERGKVAQAHAELVALADRLAALVEANQQQPRPWWRRMLAG